MMKKRAVQRAGGLMAVLLVAAGTLVSSAQDAKLEARPLTHQDIHDYGLPAATQASGGLLTVGLGQPVYLEALVGVDVTTITGLTFAIAVQPPGGTDVLEASPLGEMVPIYEPKDREEFQLAGRSMLRPTVQGQYTVTLTGMADGMAFDATMEVVAATYMGINTCKLCHSGGMAGVSDNWEPWSKTDHATFFTEAIDGNMSSHYNSGCIQCHVVGYDTDPLAVNGGFDDIAAGLNPPWTFPTELVPGNWDAMDPALQNLSNIQCENCHGAGSQHAITALVDPDGSKDLIHVNFSSGDCAQCHSEEPYHVFPLQWENSKHAVAVTEERTSCAGCHQGVGFIDQTDGLSPIRTEYSPINCSACHDPHDATNPHQIRTVADVTLKDTSKPGGPTVVTEGGNGKLCMQCHISRRDAVTYVENYHSHYGPHHGPQTDMFVGANAITYGKDIPSSAAHLKLEGSCVACHMQDTSRTSPEHLLAGGHSWNMAWDDMGMKTDVVGACTECHGDIDSFDFQQQDYDGNGIVDGAQTEVKGLLSRLAYMLPPVGVPKPDHSPDNLSVDPTWTKPQLSAAYNYLFVVEDGSWGVHNMSYAVGLLKASIADLSGDANGDGVADWWQEQYFGADWVSNPDAARNASPSGDDIPNWLKFTLGLDPYVAGVATPEGVVWTNGIGIGGGPDGEAIDPGVLHIYTAAEIAFATEVGTDYQIEGASELSGGWQPIGDLITGDGAVISYLTPTRDKVQMFFRVIQTPTPPAAP